MNQRQVGLLRNISLSFLLPGLAGLVVSATLSTHYLLTLPHMPAPAEERMVPRSIHGTVIYQTDSEDRRLTLLEDGSVTIFVIGLGGSLVYLRKWGIYNALAAEDEEEAFPNEVS